MQMTEDEKIISMVEDIKVVLLNHCDVEEVTRGDVITMYQAVLEAAGVMLLSAYKTDRTLAEFMRHGLADFCTQVDLAAVVESEESNV